jgi:hypothetical protein
MHLFDFLFIRGSWIHPVVSEGSVLHSTVLCVPVFCTSRNLVAVTKENGCNMGKDRGECILAKIADP